MNVDPRDFGDIELGGGGGGGGVAPSIRPTNLADLTAFLDMPKVIAYGTVGPVAGNLALLHELSDKTRVAFVMLGEGPWDSQLYLGINRKSIALPDTTRVHFHQGFDGTIGGGLAATSTGPDQGVDSFWSSLPGTLDKVTFSRYAYLALKLAPDPGAPTADFEIIGHYKALQCRIFDNTGTQTAFQWTDNPAWWICDYLIRKFIKRGGRINEPLTAEEKARFNWQSFVDAASWCDADIGGGVKRWSKGGLWFNEDTDAQAALEKLLLYCQSYLLEVDGIIYLIPDQSRATEFTFYARDVEPDSFRISEDNVEGQKNRYIGKFRDLNLASGSTEELTRYSEATIQIDHFGHQLAIGTRGSGLSPVATIEEATFDFGVCSAEQVYRRLHYEIVRQLGPDPSPGETYSPPKRAEWTASERTVSVLQGARVTIDKGISEEHAGDYEVLDVQILSDGRLRFKALEWVDAFSDTYPAQQSTQAPTAGTGLLPTSNVGAHPVVSPTGPFSYDSGGSAISRMWARVRWKTTSGADYNYELPDGGQILIKGSASLSIPAAPTLQQIAGGTLGGRTRFVRIALVKEGVMFGIGAEASLAISANNLLKVVSPAAVAGYDGWVPLVGQTSNNERLNDDVSDTTKSNAVPILFGTDYTEPVTGVDFGPVRTPWVDDGVQAAAHFWNLGVSTNYKLLPTYELALQLAHFTGGITATAHTEVNLARVHREGFMPLSSAVFIVTTPAAGGSGSGSGGGGTGDPCFSGDTPLRLHDGENRRIDQICVGDLVRTRKGPRRVRRLRVRRYKGPMRVMPCGGLVTPGHAFAEAQDWVEARTLFLREIEFEGDVHNLELEAEPAAREYELWNGHVAHNSLQC